MTVVKQALDFLRDRLKPSLYSILEKKKDSDNNCFFRETTLSLKKQGLFYNLKPDEGNKYYFIGDLHGDIDSLCLLLNTYWDPNSLFIFLGDYVDRGKDSFQVLILLFLLKSEFPEKIILLAGNHEIYHLIKFFPSNFWISSEYYSFEKQWINAFKYLSLAGKIGKIFFMHGIPYHFQNQDEMQNLLNSFDTIDSFYDKYPLILKYLLWGDILPEELENTRMQSRGTGLDLLNHSEFNYLCNRLDLTMLIRAHQPDSKGLNFNNRCLTLLTSEHYAYYGKLKGKLIARITFDKISATSEKNISPQYSNTKTQSIITNTDENQKITKIEIIQLDII